MQIAEDTDFSKKSKDKCHIRLRLQPQSTSIKSSRWINGSKMSKQRWGSRKNKVPSSSRELLTTPRINNKKLSPYLFHHLREILIGNLTPSYGTIINLSSEVSCVLCPSHPPQEQVLSSLPSGSAVLFVWDLPHHCTSSLLTMLSSTLYIIYHPHSVDVKILSTLFLSSTLNPRFGIALLGQNLQDVCNYVASP